MSKKEIFYEKENEHGKYYENAEGLIFQAYGKDPTYAFFKKLLSEKKIEVVPFKGSDIEKAEKKAELEAKKATERSWRDGELEKLDKEAWIILEEAVPALKDIKKRKQALRDYPNAKNFPRNKRPE